MLYTNVLLQEETAKPTTSSEVLDAKGIPDWDWVDQLARALLALKGLSVTNEQAREIVRLYNQLEEYDKKPLVCVRRPSLHKSRGCFGQTNKCVEDASLEYKKRWIVTCLLVPPLHNYVPLQMFSVSRITTIMPLQKLSCWGTVHTTLREACTTLKEARLSGLKNLYIKVCACIHVHWSFHITANKIVLQVEVGDLRVQLSEGPPLQ